MANVKINNIKLENLYLLSMSVKICIGILIVLVMIFFAYFLLFSSQLETIEVLEGKEKILKEKFTTKVSQSVYLPILKGELKQLETEFAILVKQLPTEAEVPGLIKELHQAAVNNGLKFTTLKANEPAIKSSVSVISYDIVTSGSYNQLIKFAISIGGLNRIVVLDKFNLTKLSNNKNSNVLELRAKVNTYQSVFINNSLSPSFENSPNN